MNRSMRTSLENGPFEKRNARTRRPNRSFLPRRSPKRERLPLFELLERREVLAVEFVPDGVGEWKEQGPFGITNGQVDNIDPISGGNFRNAVVGAVQSLALFNSPAGGGKRGAYAATVNGGIWGTNDITSANPVWGPLTDKILPKSFLSVITLPGAESDHDIIYAGTGNRSSGHLGNALGIFRSNNRGATWSQLSTGYIPEVANNEGKRPTSSFLGVNVNKLIAPKKVNGSANTGDHIFAATDSGLLETTNGGIKTGSGDSADPGWSLLSGFRGLPTGAVLDMVEVLNDAGTDSAALYVAVANQGIYRTEDFLNWTQVNPAGQTFNLVVNMKLAAFGQGSSARVYAAIAEFASVTRLNPSTALFASFTVTKTTVYYSDNRGSAWTSLGQPSTNEDLDGNGTDESLFYLHGSNQASMHFSFSAHPTNKDIVFVGGDTQPPGVPPKSESQNGRLFRYSPSGGWQQIVGKNAGGTGPHADSRSITLYVDSGTVHLFETDDGGIYHLSSPDTDSRRWTSRIGPLDGTVGSLAITEVWDVAYNRKTNKFFIGAQDNGGSLQQTGNQPWLLTNYGDGTFQAYDTAADGKSITYSIGNAVNNFAAMYRRLNGVETYFDYDPANPSAGFLGLSANDRALSGFNIVKFELNDCTTCSSPQFVAMGFKSLYESDTMGTTWTPIPLHNSTSGDFIRAIAYGTGPHPMVMYAAYGKKIGVRDNTVVTDPGKSLSGTVLGRPLQRSFEIGTEIFDIVINPDDWQVAYASSFQQLWRTTNGGVSWVDISANLPKNGNYRAVEIYNPTSDVDDEVVLIGSAGGVFATHTPRSATPTWSLVGKNLPRVQITEIQYDPGPTGGKDLLYVGTFGRGVWRLDEPAKALANVLVVTGDSDPSKPHDTIVIQRNAADTSLIDIVGASASPVTVPLDMVRSILVDSKTGSDTLRIDNTLGLIATYPYEKLSQPFIGYLADRDDDLDTLEFTGLNSKTTVRQVDDDSGDSVFVVSSTDLGLSTTIGVVNVEIKPLIVIGSVSTEAPKKAAVGIKNLNTAFRNVSSKDAQPKLPFTSVMKKSKLITPEPIGLPVPRSTSMRRTLLAENRSGAAVEDIIEGLFLRGDGSNVLDDFGGSVADADAMVVALDSLDETNGNVSKTTLPDGTILFDVQIVKPVSGDTHLTPNLLGNLVDVNAVAHLSGTVHARFIIGIDQEGFFLQTETSDESDIPEITFSDITGTVEGAARLGFIEVNLNPSNVVVDPTVALTINIHDPGTEGVIDGKLRIDEFDPSLGSEFVTVALNKGTSSGMADLKIEGVFDVVGFNTTLLQDLALDISWPDITDLSAGNVAPRLSGNAQALIDFLNTNGNDIRNAVLTIADAIQQSTGSDVLATKIPVVNKSLRDILESTPQPLLVTGAIVRSSTFDTTADDSSPENGITRFELTGGTLDSVSAGIQVGDTLEYTLASTNAPVSATVTAVLGFGLEVEIAADVDPTPKTGTTFSIQRSGSLSSSFGGFLSRDFRIPTLQELVHSISLTTGIDLFDSVTFVGTPGTPDFAIQIPITFDPDPKIFRMPLDFSTGANGLKLDASVTAEVIVDPKFQFTIGVRLAADPGDGTLPLVNRVYVVASKDDTPPAAGEPQPTNLPLVTLDVTARLNDPNVQGTIGFLDVTLSENLAPGAQEDNPETPVDEDGNKGIQVVLTATVDLTDADATPTDQRIELQSIVQNPLQIFSFDVDGAVDIDGLKLKAAVGGSVTLLDAVVSIEGEGDASVDGHFEDFSELGEVLGDIQFTNYADYSQFQNISIADVLAALQMLIEKLEATGRGGVFDRPIPVVNRSVSELIDLGQVFFSAIGEPESDGSVASAKKLETYFNSKLGTANNTNPVAVKVTQDAIRFQFTVARGFEHDVPLAFSTSTAGLSIAADANVVLTACGTLNLTFGILTAPGLDFAQRFFVDTDAANSNGSGINVDVRANAGYTSNPPCGGATVANEEPIDIDAAVGPLALHIEDARLLANLRVGGNLTTTASDKKIRLGNLGSTSIAAAFNGSIQGIVPIDGDNNGSASHNPAQVAAGDALVKFGGRFTNATTNQQFQVNFVADAATGNLPVPATASDPIPDASLPENAFRLETHDLTQLISSRFLNFGALIEGLEKFLDWADSALGSDFLDKKIPFLGKSIRDGFNFLESDDSSANTLRSLIQRIINQRLGTGGVDSLGPNLSDTAVDAAIDHIESVLAAVPGITALAGTPIGTPVKSGNSTTGAIFRFQYSPSFNVTRPFDLGLDFLRLQADASGVVTFDGDLTLTLGFGIDKTQGFFLITNLPAPEFALSGSITATGLLNAQLGFLDVGVTLNPGTRMDASFTADIVDTNSDNRLTLGELVNPSLLSTIFRRENVHLNVEAHLRATLSTSINPQLPSLTTDLVLDWGIADPTEPDLFRSFDLLNLANQNLAPAIALNNITLDVGTFVAQIVQPIFVKVQESGIIPPKLKSFLETEIVLLKRTPKDLLLEVIEGTKNEDLFRFLLETSVLLAEAVSNVNAANQNSLKINFGNITIARSSANSNQATPTPVPDATKPEVKRGTTSDGKLTDKKTEEGNIDIPGSGLPAIGSFLEKLGNMGIYFPFLRISNLAQLIVGNDIDLVLIDLPQLKIEKDFNVSFPLVGAGIGDIVSIAISAYLGGGFDFVANIAGGFDTSGIRQGKLTDGFYLGDFNPNSPGSMNGQIDPTDVERPEIQFSGFVQAGVEGGVEVLGFGVGVVEGYFRIQADINVELNDDNEINGVAPICDDRTIEERHDGKVHINEMATIARSHDNKLLSILEMSGEVFAELGAHVTVLGGLLYDKQFTTRFDLLNFEDLEFPVKCPPPGGGGGGSPGPTCGDGFASPSFENDLFDVTISPQDLAENDPDAIATTIEDLNGLAFDGGGINTFDPDELVIDEFADVFEFSSPLSGTDFATFGMQAGQGVAWTQNGAATFGHVTGVRGSTFTVRRLNTGGTTPVGAVPPTSASIDVYSPAESIVIEQAGNVEIFGPTGCGPNNTTNAGASSVNSISTADSSTGLGPGNDTFIASPKVNIPIFINGGRGNDTVVGGGPGSVLNGGLGNDRLSAGNNIGNNPSRNPRNQGVQLSGGKGNDKLSGSRGDDTLSGGDGNDLIHDLLESIRDANHPSGNDTVVGGGGKDALISRGGDDVLVGDYDAQLDPRPAATDQRYEDSDLIERNGGGDTVVFGDNHGAARDETGPAPDASRNTSDQIKVDDSEVRVFAERGDDVKGNPTLRINAAAKSYTINAASITLDGDAPIRFAPTQPVHVEGGDGSITIEGDSGNDDWLIKSSGTGLEIRYRENAPIIVSNVAKLSFLGSTGDDRVTLTYQSGDPLLSSSFLFDGGSAATSTGDVLRVVGLNTVVASLALSPTDTRGGSLKLNTRNVTLKNTTQVELTDLQKLTWQSPAGPDVAIIGPTTDSNLQAATLVTSKGNVARTKTVATNVRDLVVDAGTLDSSTHADSVRLTMTGLASVGLQNLTIQTGGGTDVLSVFGDSLRLPVAGGILRFDAGLGADTLNVTANADMTLDGNVQSIAMGGGTMTFAGLTNETANLTGGAANNRFTLLNWSGSATLDGAAGADLLALTAKGGTITTIDELNLVSPVTTTAHTTTATLRGNVTLPRGTMIFNVADGTANPDLRIEATVNGSLATSITKSGLGTLNVQGANSSSGATNVTAGTLVVDGDQSGSSFAVSGGILSGIGTIGALNVTAATVGPGSTTGKLTTRGSLVLGATSTFRAELNGTFDNRTTGGFDNVAVVGGVNLGGSQLVTTVGFASLPGNSYRIIDNDGTDAVVGTFAGLAEGATLTASGFQFRISYVGGTGNDVVLTHIKNTAPAFASRTVTSNIDEGDEVVLTGTIVEADAGDQFVLEVQWGDGTPMQAFPFDPSQGLDVELRHRYADNHRTDGETDPYVIDLLWKDQDGAFNRGFLTTTVNNVAPVVTARAIVTESTAGQFRGSGQFTDAGADSWFATVDYGDGTELQSLALDPTGRFQLNHTYSAAGNYLVNVAVTDDDGGIGQSQVPVRVAEIDGEPVLVWFHNARQGADVDADGFVVPLDVLHIVNQLNLSGAGDLSDRLDEIDLNNPRYYDANGDNFLTPIDALLVINFLNGDIAAEGEGELAVLPLDTFIVGQATNPRRVTSIDRNEVPRSTELPVYSSNAVPSALVDAAFDAEDDWSVASNRVESTNLLAELDAIFGDLMR